MPRLLLFLVTLLLSVAAIADPPAPAAPLAKTAAVDERVELLMIVARLAGNDEYNMPNSASPYAKRVAAHFGPYKDHKAISSFQAMRRDRGASYDAVPSLALHLDGVPSLQPRMPFEPRPLQLDARWDPARTAAFLEDLRAFAVDSNARAYFDQERGFYDAVEARLAAFAAKADAVAWFDRFFGVRQSASYVVIPGLLAGGGNFGMSVTFPETDANRRPEEIRPVLGCWTWDSEGLPVFAVETYLPTYVHELCHAYTNRIVDAHKDVLEPPANRIYPAVARRMQRMAYANGLTMMYESIVRACVVRFLLERDGKDAARKEAEAQAAAGFVWVPGLAELLGTYEKDRATYPTFDAFVPEIARFFNDKAVAMVDEIARKEKDAAEKAPRLLGMTPENGAVDVDAALDAMVLRFDQPMRDGSWSFVGSKENLPEFVGQPSYDATRRILTVKVKLRRGATYTFYLNSDRFKSFTSADGYPLAPVRVTFTVRK
ncbi:MAG: DUF4932 domain-containing protein [Phycisphaerae bacterium]|nr:DUF4932 domain-containing protein [Phycisphaerae bacterium]